jgi:hypothetical protein
MLVQKVFDFFDSLDNMELFPIIFSRRSAMRQILWGGFLSVAFLTVFAGVSSACIWDREVTSAEREFKSHYKNNYQQEPAIQSSEPLNNQLLGYARTVLGSALLLGSVVVTLRRPQ